MKRKLVLIMSLAGLAVSGTAFAEGNDALLDKLIEKGTLTKEDAQDIQSKKVEFPAALKGLSIGALAYVDYSSGETGKNDTHFNQFTLTRGYINIKKEITPWMRARITPDIYAASDGSTVLRMKYLYADFLTPDLGPVTDNDVRAGLGHTPWLDFAESINIYRMQGTMFQERNGIQNSADLGVGLLGNFGGALSKEQQSEVGYSTPYSGRYGGYHIGVYNGGGYKAATDANQDKAVEGRITVRPLPDMVPGLQLTYSGIYGKGNSTANNGQGLKWSSNTGYVSYQMKYLVLTGEYVAAKGEQSGKDENSGHGYSLFGDFRLPFYTPVSVFARYDNWNPGTSSSSPGTQLKQNTTIGGLGYRIYGNNYIIAAYDNVHYDMAGKSDDKKGQVVLQVAF